MKLRAVSIGMSSGVLLGIECFLMYTCPQDDIVSMLCAPFFFLLFCGFPPIVSIFLSVRSKSPISQIVLATTSLLYGSWFAYVCYDAFFVNLDPQSAIILVFVGIYALPVLLPLWITARVVDMWHCKKSKQNLNGSEP